MTKVFKTKVTNYKILYFILLLFSWVSFNKAWRAIPANQASYALRDGDDEDYDDRLFKTLLNEEDRLPRGTLNSVYKFGWCTRDMVVPVHYKKSVNVTLPTWKSTNVNYIYVLVRKNTIQYRHQCVILKMYVPFKFMFHKARLPIYYCQGTVHILMMNTINKFEIHEFYIKHRLLVPANFVVEFYHGKSY